MRCLNVNIYDETGKLVRENIKPIAMNTVVVRVKIPNDLKEGQYTITVKNPDEQESNALELNVIR